MNVIISGLTAAGKTTHSRLLARRHELSYISASALLLDASGIKDTARSGFWDSAESQSFEARRQRDRAADRYVDAAMVELAETTNGAVFDAWGLPWLTNRPAFRIWLASSFQSRVWKAMVSSMSRGESLSYNSAAQIVSSKDDTTRSYFLEEYGFDIYGDLELFDLAIDLSDFITKPTIPASRLSIHRSDDLIGAAVAWALEPTGEMSLTFKRHVKRHGQRAIIKCPESLNPY